MNIVILCGRWTRDLELRYTPNGTAVANGTLATDRRTKEKKTDFNSITLLGKLAENVAQYSGKGRLVSIVGTLQTDSWEKEGKRNYKTYVLANSVEFLDYKKDDLVGTGTEVTDEDIPF